MATWTKTKDRKKAEAKKAKEAIDNTRHYVVGFMFSEDWQQIALIRKSEDGSIAQHRGKLNGIGGKVEEDEDYSLAMRREGREEAKYIGQWKYQGSVIGSGWQLGIFYTVCDLSKLPHETDIGERFEIWHLTDLHKLECVDNLAYLIPLCQDDRINFTIVDVWQPE